MFRAHLLRERKLLFSGQFFPLEGIKDCGITSMQTQCIFQAVGMEQRLEKGVPILGAELNKHTSCMRTLRCPWEGVGDHLNLSSRHYNRNSNRNNEWDKEQEMMVDFGKAAGETFQELLCRGLAWESTQRRQKKGSFIHSGVFHLGEGRIMWDKEIERQLRKRMKGRKWWTQSKGCRREKHKDRKPWNKRNILILKEIAVNII